MNAKAPWWVGTVLAVAVVAFGYFVWPTQWKAEPIPPGTVPAGTTFEVRKHRFTGEIQGRMRETTGWSEWISLVNPDGSPAVTFR